MPRLVVAVIGLTFALAACKGDAKKCEQACRNYFTLRYWKKADADIAKEPEARRKLARQEKLSIFANELEGGVDFCVSQCQSANNDKDTDCLIEAKTAEDAESCVTD